LATAKLRSTMGLGVNAPPSSTGVRDEAW